MPLPDTKRWFVSRQIPETKFSGMPSLEGHRLLMRAMKEKRLKRLIDYGTPSVKFASDKRSFITVFPRIADAILSPSKARGR